MKRLASIKSKLLFLLFATILLTLILVGISLDILIQRFYQDEANKSFSSLFHEISSQLLDRQNALMIHANRLSHRNEIIATVNMIYQYASPQDYQPLVYDGEKRKLAMELRKEARASNINEIAIYDGNGMLISFFTKDSGEDVIGYLSFEYEQPVIYFSNNDPLNPWLKAPLPASLPQQLDIAEATSQTLHYHEFQNGFSIQNYKPVTRTYPDGTQKVVGYITLKHDVSTPFVEQVSKKVGVDFAIFIGDQMRVGNLDLGPQQPGKTAVISKIAEELPFSRNDHSHYFTATSTLILEGGSRVTMLAAVPKAVVNKAITNTQFLVLLVLIMAAAIILPLGFLVANRTISRPLGKLSEGVSALQKGEYGTRVSLGGHDELNILADAFNAMSSSIHQREAELVESENKYRNLVDNLPQSIFFKDRDSVYVSCNRRYAEQLGIHPEDIVGKTDFDFFSESYASKYRQDDSRIMRTGIMEELEEPYEGNAASGTIFTVKTPIRSPDGEVIGILGIFWDITDKKQAEKQLRQAAAVFESTADGVLVTDVDRNIIAVNHAFTEITGYSEREALGRKPSFRRSERQDDNFYQRMWADILKEGRWQGEIWNRRKDGEVYPEWMTISTVNDGEGNISNYVAVFSDITNVMRSQMELDHMAHHDPLTDLPNRTLLNDRLSQAINRARRHARCVAVLFLDLDRFKNVNDTLGHPTGDLLLQDVAKRLQGLLREQDTVARLGGDEFIIIVEDLDRPEEAEAIATKMIEALSMPFSIHSHELFIGASIGISISPDDSLDTSTLIKYADSAMYRAKEKGRNTYQFYTEELTQSAMERLELESALRRALQREELELFFQPQVNLTNGEIIGAEALLRWHHPELGMVPPDKFIPLAEESGLIHEIGEWVLHQACFQAVKWSEKHKNFTRIAVNLSGVQVQRGDIVDRVSGALKLSGLPARMLELEITESVLMQHPEIAAETLGGLREIGIELAIDDFGTGYSSLSYLKRFPLQILKIDRSFVMDIPNDVNDTAITRAVIALGKSLQLKLIAEGVETVEQEAFLTKEGCDIGQGYYYSRPIDSATFTRLLEDETHFAIKSTTPSLMSPL